MALAWWWRGGGGGAGAAAVVGKKGGLKFGDLRTAHSTGVKMVQTHDPFKV